MKNLWLERVDEILAKTQGKTHRDYDAGNVAELRRRCELPKVATFALVQLAKRKEVLEAK
jgi:hypothetical protein